MPVAKRKRSAVEVSKPETVGNLPPPKRGRSARLASTTTAAAAAAVNPDLSADVVDAPNATRASPDSHVNAGIVPGFVKQEPEMRSESPLSEAPDVVEPPAKKGRKGAKVKQEQRDGTDNSFIPAAAKEAAGAGETGDPEGDELEVVDEEEVKEALARPPPVNSDYLPLPWKGRLGYACLNTYLRSSNPPVFSSRTCRIQSILEHRHPLQDPSQPEHPTKNRPDRNKPADVELGKRYVESLCLANVHDIIKTVRWNDRYNIRFFRLSSEMFPFASHPEYGYELAPFASSALAEAGKVITQLGHRVTTHPGQFTQLGSPRKQVIDNSIRDLAYHDEMLSLLQLSPQQNADAIMVLHMGGIFDGKAQTLSRFRENYALLPPSVRKRLVLENDDMGWSVHDLLPLCEELNIPLVLDFHHHNIVFDREQIREGTNDIIALFPRILATWERKGITPKMHYSEPTPMAITPRQRRKHNPRVASLPPCPPHMDLMIEAKDKEQAVFELMRNFKLPGFEKLNDVVPYTRDDDNKAALAAQAKKAKSSSAKDKAAVKGKDDEAAENEVSLVPDEDVAMGGSEGRVYWPPGMEEWLRPKKREVKKKEPPPGSEKGEGLLSKQEAAEAYAAREEAKKTARGTTKGKKAAAAATASAETDGEEVESDVDATPATKKAKAAMRKKVKANEAKAAAAVNAGAEVGKKVSAAPKKGKPNKKAAAAAIPSPPSEEEMEEELEWDPEEEDRHDGDELATKVSKRAGAGAARKGGGRAAKKRVSYAEYED